jgi:diguanylate cyclase (GGDEF)-like protein
MIRPSLQQVLRRALLAVVVTAVTLAGSLLTVLATVALRHNSRDNLQLVARSAGYALEAAVVFHDRPSAEEDLALIARTEDVAEAWVYDREDRVLAHWRRLTFAPWQELRDRAAELLLPPTIEQPILHEDQEVGRVVMRGAGGGPASFLLGGIVALLGCLGLSVLAADWSLQRVLRRILAPLRALAEVARAGRIERTLSRRVPAARIAEFHGLGQDVNALLAELEARQDDLRRENVHLAEQASTDGLTGLHNRTVFEQRLAQAVTSAGAGTRAGERRLAVLFLDADRFKQINDSLGHEVGDVVLVAIAARIRRQVRQQDLVARLGGDEFAVLLDGLLDAALARRIADAIATSMVEPVELAGGGRVAVALSIGVAVFPDDARDAAGLLRAADAAMYRDKRSRALPPAMPSMAFAAAPLPGEPG